MLPRPYPEMFYNCASLISLPALPVKYIDAQGCSQMFYGCTKIKLSETQTGTYTQEYRIPASGTVTTKIDNIVRMFTNTGGTFAGTPELNKTYYLDNSNTIV